MKPFLRPFYERWIDFQAKQAVLWLTILAGLFLGLSFAIHLPATSSLDLYVTKSIQQGHSPILDQLAFFFTFLGNTWTLIVVGVLLAAYFLFRGRKVAGILCLVTLIGVPLNYAIKEVIGRPRPDGSLVSVMLPTVGLSFPSGHAMASTMLYGFFALMSWTLIRDHRLRVVATSTLAVTPILISLSRIYVGAHWFSDVVGGWAAGLLCLVIIGEMYKHYETQVDQPINEA